MFIVGLNKNSVQPYMKSGKGCQTQKQTFFCFCILYLYLYSKWRRTSDRWASIITASVAITLLTSLHHWSLEGCSLINADFHIHCYFLTLIFVFDGIIICLPYYQCDQFFRWAKYGRFCSESISAKRAFWMSSNGIISAEKRVSQNSNHWPATGSQVWLPPKCHSSNYNHNIAQFRSKRAPLTQILPCRHWLNTGTELNSMAIGMSMISEQSWDLSRPSRVMLHWNCKKINTLS